MKKSRNLKWISYFLIIAVVIFGICIEKIPAGSRFLCNQTNTIVKADSTFGDMSVCRIDDFTQRENIISLKSAKRACRQNQIRSKVLSGIALLETYLVSQHSFRDQIIENESAYDTNSYFKEILSYIHNQDGEKA